MKIGFLITYFFPQKGGAETNCHSLAKELAKKHEVHVFCSGDKDSEEIIDNIKVHRCKESFRIKYYLAFYPSLLKKLLKQDLEVLHVHGFGFLQHDLSISLLKIKNPKTKIVCTPHGPFMALKSYNLVQTVFKNIYMPFLRRSLRNYSIIIQVNPNQKCWLKKDYKIPEEKIRLLPNGIHKETFKKIPPQEIDKISKEYNLNKRFVISYLGRIQEYKGVYHVVNILPELKKSIPNILFVAIGRDAGEKERLEKLAKKLNVSDNLLFAGEVDENKKLALLELSEIFIFPSEWEAFGIATLEAMARENAVASTRTEGGVYLIKEGENGFLSDIHNEKQLLKNIETLSKDNSLRKKIQQQNFKKAKEFLWEDIAQDLEKIYKELK